MGPAGKQAVMSARASVEATHPVEERPAAKRTRRKPCVHRWVLGEPEGGVIAARCRLCSRTRTYAAYPDGGDRFDDYREITAASQYHWARFEGRPAA